MSSSAIPTTQTRPKLSERLITLTFHFKPRDPFQAGGFSLELAKNGSVPVTIGGEVQDAYCSRTGELNPRVDNIREEFRRLSGRDETISHLVVNAYPTDVTWEALSNDPLFVNRNKGGIKIERGRAHPRHCRITLSPEQAAPHLRRFFGFNI